mmetsp:Transcript_5509/g.6780  ORF Transcript_5509/g.6780 Transcript_5509/m.6780 type:complete len:109 (-) Transcript_5509:38-364(-)
MRIYGQSKLKYSITESNHRTSVNTFLKNHKKDANVTIPSSGDLWVGIQTLEGFRHFFVNFNKRIRCDMEYDVQELEVMETPVHGEQQLIRILAVLVLLSSLHAMFCCK